jgi:hypothetical protein
MIRLKSTHQILTLETKIPETAIKRMVQLEGHDGLYDPDRHGYLIIVDNDEDDLMRDIPEAGPLGLHTHLDDEFQNQFEYVSSAVEDGIVVYEAVMQIDNEKTIAVFIPETFPLHPQLRLVLENEAACSPD